MKVENPNLAAYPLHHRSIVHSPGLTKRELAAIQILQGLAAFQGAYASTHEAIRLADELLERLQRKDNE